MIRKLMPKLECQSHDENINALMRMTKIELQNLLFAKPESICSGLLPCSLRPGLLNKIIIRLVATHLISVIVFIF